ncbi:DUF2505 domain-containing protein [Mycolicibacterium litorale]|uniref:DUF2505 domain-containing protein n=1 Tax=Mycolicibacterium litorale TaxID=758802 RepID=A0AAD1IL87_9MYCO|nr:DUF2505 domain-containing protein [Mycolicibacterium litorale]MCV7416700.1 DUF2505 domain-containing protein [Mycolicibacterium litorale]TDY09952.1 uncharacterized protein DUF2505 [Mycolicibacterium litorale]BBY17912.1 hypothetical protein MLIT_35040 [Mycolicibacterium litorale]
MPRSFDLAADYEGTVEEVHRAFADEQYWLARLADSGADAATLDAMTVGEDGSIDVTTTQILRADRLPGVVAQFHRGDLSIQREETWTGVRDGVANATVTGSIPGAPVTLTGTAVLAPSAAGGARLELKVTVEVRVPLVGGKIENFIGTGLVDLIIAEQRFTTVWITENV